MIRLSVIWAFTWHNSRLESEGSGGFGILILVLSMKTVVTYTRGEMPLEPV